MLHQIQAVPVTCNYVRSAILTIATDSTLDSREVVLISIHSVLSTSAFTYGIKSVAQWRITTTQTHSFFFLTKRQTYTYMRATASTKPVQSTRAFGWCWTGYQLSELLELGFLKDFMTRPGLYGIENDIDNDRSLVNTLTRVEYLWWPIHLGSLLTGRICQLRTLAHGSDFKGNRKLTHNRHVLSDLKSKWRGRYQDQSST